MKRKIALLLLSLCLLLSLAAPVLADEDPISAAAQATVPVAELSEDLMRVRIGDETFVRADVSLLAGYYNLDISVTLTEDQKTTIKSASASRHRTGIALRVDLTYQDNAQLTVYYIDEARQAEYQKLLEQDTVTVDLLFPDDNTVDISLNAAKGEEEILFRNDLYEMNQFGANVTNAEDLRVQRGTLLIDDDQYYYFDYAENGTTNVFEPERARAWLITDEATCAALDAAMDEYYKGLGIFESEDFSLQISKWFLIIVFVALPIIALAVFVFLAIRAKTAVYRKLFINLCAWSGVVLLFVGLIAWVVNSY